MSETESVYEKARRELEEEGWNCETCANWRKHEATLAALDAGEKAEQEKDQYLIAMVYISEWIDRERQKWTNQARGGQMVGDSHSPRVPPSVLGELERMVKAADSRYTYDEIRKLAERAEQAEKAYEDLERESAAEARQWQAKCEAAEKRAEKAEKFYEEWRQETAEEERQKQAKCSAVTNERDIENPEEDRRG